MHNYVKITTFFLYKTYTERESIVIIEIRILDRKKG